MTSTTTSGKSLVERGKSIRPAHFAIALTVVFFAIGLVGITHHEMWRDELRAWLIARESSTVMQLFDLLQYEGTPPLWHLCLFGLTRFTADPFAMQIFHLTLASACVFLVARFSPFAMWQKILIAFGYFPFFEYAQISRSYVLCNLFLFGFCALCTGGRRNYPLLLLALFALANTTVYGAIFAFSIGVALLLERLGFNRGQVPKVHQAETDGRSSNKRILAVGLAILVVSAALFVVQMKPPSDGFTGDWNSYGEKYFSGSAQTGWRITKSFSSILTSYLPVPRYKDHFWTSTIFRDEKPASYVWVVVSLCMFLYATSRLKDTLSQTSYVLGTLGFVTFTFLFYLGTTRHNGMLFILLLACVWMALDYRRLHKNSSPANGNRSLASTVSMYLFSAVLIIHALLGCFAFYIDFHEVFSPTKDVAKFLREQHLDAYRIVVAPDYCGTGLSVFLRRPIYSLASRKQFTYERLNSEERQDFFLRSRVQLLVQWWDQPFVLLSRDRMNTALPVGRAKLLKHFRRTILFDEGQYLYLVEPPGKSTKLRRRMFSPYLLWRMWPNQRFQRFFYGELFPPRFTGQSKSLTGQSRAPRQFQFWLRPVECKKETR